MKNTPLIFFCVTLLFSPIHAQNTWTQKASLGMGRQGPAGFSIGDKGYVGGGTDGNGNYFYDFWEYDPASDVWTQKADIAGATPYASFSFSIQGKGYIGTGFGPGIVYSKNFSEYNPDMNTWTQKADFGGEGRAFAIGFSIGNKGYGGTGFMWDGTGHYLGDFWEYDPDADVWTQKANFGGGARAGAVGFSIEDKGYVGTGMFVDSIYGYSYSDFYEYNPLTDSWTQKSDFGEMFMVYGVGFSIGSKGYAGAGEYSNHFWEYDPSQDQWTQKAEFPGMERAIPCGFSIGTKGYLGMGLALDTNAIVALNDFWEFSTEAVGISSIDNHESQLSVFPNPAIEKVYIRFTLLHPSSVNLKVCDPHGREVLTLVNDELQTGNHSFQLNTSEFAKGVYLVKMISDFGIENQKLIVQ